MTQPKIDYDSVAEIYDIYVTAQYDIQFFQAEAAKVNGAVLELMAGTGRLSLPLIETGVKLTCVDVSHNMLEVLERKLVDQNLQAILHCQDVCELTLDPVYDLAVMPFQSFMELVGQSRQETALQAIFDSLTPGGQFICTLHNPVVRRTIVDGRLRVVGRFQAEEGTLIVSGFEQGGKPVVKRLQFFEFFGNDGYLQTKRLLPMEFEFIEKAQFEAMAQGVGFKVIDLYGDYERSPFNEAHSPVMIWILEKPV